MRRTIKLKMKKLYLVILILISICQFSFLNLSNLENNTGLGYLKLNSIRNMNVTIISDYLDGEVWNNGSSGFPSIAFDNNGTIHVVWQDYTEGIWSGGASDSEIMYASYIEGLGWSNAIVISDGYAGVY